ncbi:MAG: hypothetical protein QM689_10855 [Oscillospiraceae bacterium]
MLGERGLLTQNAGRGLCTLTVRGVTEAAQVDALSISLSALLGQTMTNASLGTLDLSASMLSGIRFIRNGMTAAFTLEFVYKAVA